MARKKKAHKKAHTKTIVKYAKPKKVHRAKRRKVSGMSNPMLEGAMYAVAGGIVTRFIMNNLPTDKTTGKTFLGDNTKYFPLLVGAAGLFATKNKTINQMAVGALVVSGSTLLPDAKLQALIHPKKEETAPAAPALMGLPNTLAGRMLSESYLNPALIAGNKKKTHYLNGNQTSTVPSTVGDMPMYMMYDGV
jgi:hypothetical protein